jgi:hypothetical protein
MEGRVAYSRYCPDICLKGLKKTTKDLSQDSLSPVLDMNRGLPEYEAGVLTTRMVYHL